MLDAKSKASVLARAAEVTLGEIQSIDYSFGELALEARPVGRLMTAKNAADSAGYTLDIEPDDLFVTDTVTVVWEIG